MGLLDKVDKWWGRADQATTVLQWIGLWKPLIALGTAVLTFVIGYIQKTPIACVIPAALVASGAILWVLNQIDAWVLRNSVSGHMGYARLNLICHGKMTYPNPPYVGYQPVIVFRNTSPRCIYYRMNRMHSVIGGKGIARPAFDSREGIIQPNSESEFLYAIVPDIDASDGPIEGVIDFDFSYGRSKAAMPYTIKQRRTITVSWANPDKSKPPNQIQSVEIQEG